MSTHLQISGLPGRPYGTLIKPEEEFGGPKGTFAGGTRLSILGLPGGPYGVLAKPLPQVEEPIGEAIWPPSLLGLPLSEYEEQPAFMQRTPMEVGPDKLRRTYTKGLRQITMRLLFERNQVETFRAFYTQTLLQGSLAFDWQHPRTQQAASFRFIRAPSYRAIGQQTWIVECPLEIVS